MSKFSEIFLANKRDWYWLFEAGKSKRKGNILSLINSNFTDLPAPVFFLSTGRTGTAWFASFFDKNKNAIVFHQASPSLVRQNKFYYEIKNNDSIDEDIFFQIGQEIFLSAREEYLVHSYKTQKIFLETNNDLLFFAEVIAKTIPNSKFVHLYRHPGDFVRSGLMRNWYKDKNQLKISPKNFEEWGNYSMIQKISWLWNEENLFIETLKEKLDKKRVFDFNFSDLSSEKLVELSVFVGSELSLNFINKFKKKRINSQKNNSIPKYKDWSDKDKNELIQICGKLSQQYGYQL